MILYFALDLVWSSRIAQQARAEGVDAARCHDPQDPRVPEASCLIVELDEDGPELIRTLRSRTDAPIVAFGPHVQATLLQQASDAGARTLPRGAFDRTLPELLRSHA